MSRRAWLAAVLAVGCGEISRRDAGDSRESDVASRLTAPTPLDSAQQVHAAASAKLDLTPFEATFPEIARQLPRVRLRRWPSALEAAGALGREIGVPDLFVKRDDLASDVFGGGKVRKLELLLGEAIALGHDTVVTLGGAGSNQAVATARFGAELGLHVVLFLAPQVRGPHVRAALLAMQRAGAELRFTPSVTAAEAEVATWPKRGRRAYVIPPGASSPLGDLAFVEAGMELALQLGAAKVETASVYIACGTGGSAAGLAVGLRVLRARARVVAVRASSPTTSSQAHLHTLVAAVVEHARSLDPTFPSIAPNDVPLTIEGSELGGGYGHATAAGREMMTLAEQRAALRLEPVYTAKALAALAHAKSREETSILWATQNGCPLGEDGDVATLPAELQAYAKP